MQRLNEYMDTARNRVNIESRSYIKPSHLLYLGFFLLMVITAAMLALPSPYHWTPFLLISGSLFVIFTYKNPFVGLFVYLIIFFLEPNTLFPFLGQLSISYEKIIAIILMSSLFIHIAFIQKKIKLYKLEYAMLIFLASCFVSIIPATDLNTAWIGFQKFSRVILVCLLLTQIVKTRNQLLAVIVLYILSVGFLGISSTVAYYSGNYEFKQGIMRAHSLGDEPIDPNTMATTLILCIPFMYFLAKSFKNKLLRIFMYLLIISCLWTVVLTGSRGGMVGAIAAFTIIAWQSRYRVKAFLLALAALAVFAVFMPQQYKERFLSIGNIGLEDETGAGASAYGRINGMILGFKFLLMNPATGVGIGNFGWHHAASEGGDWTSAHSLIGTLFGELGLLGAAAFIYFIIIFLQNIKYIRMKYFSTDWQPDFVFYMTEAIKTSLILLFVQGFFGHNLYRSNWYFFASFIIILTYLVKKRVEENINTKINNNSTKLESNTNSR